MPITVASTKKIFLR